MKYVTNDVSLVLNFSGRCLLPHELDMVLFCTSNRSHFIKLIHHFNRTLAHGQRMAFLKSTTFHI